MIRGIDIEIPSCPPPNSSLVSSLTFPNRQFSQSTSASFLDAHTEKMEPTGGRELKPVILTGSLGPASIIFLPVKSSNIRVGAKVDSQTTQSPAFNVPFLISDPNAFMHMQPLQQEQALQRSSQMTFQPMSPFSTVPNLQIQQQRMIQQFSVFPSHVNAHQAQQQVLALY